MMVKNNECDTKSQNFITIWVFATRRYTLEVASNPSLLVCYVLETFLLSRSL